MTSEDNRDRKFVERLSSDPGLVATAFGLIEDEYQGTDRFLLARRILDQELRAGPDGAAEWVYREAAGQLAARGYRDEGNALRLVADTSSVLAAADAEWRGRYLARPVTATEREGLRLIEDRQVRPAGTGGLGADGALYTPGTMIAGSDDGAPAVIVTTHAGTQEVVAGFRDHADREHWTADRMRTGPREGASPGTRLLLWSSLGDPDCRTVREEQALAWLLRGGRVDGGPARGLSDRSFITSTRAEIYLAWRAAWDQGLWGTWAAREALKRRLLRAPGWASAFTGWPFGTRALAYYDRLAATPVSELQGRSVIRALATEDAEALPAARDAGPGQRRTGRPAWHPSYGTGPAPLTQPRPDNPAPGFGPRL